VVAVGDEVAVLVAGDGVLVGLRVTGAGLLPHPAAKTASAVAAAHRRGKFTIITCLPASQPFTCLTRLRVWPGDPLSQSDQAAHRKGRD
jgi:hypothetical protein